MSVVLSLFSAGVGRTGTYVVLDAMMDQMANECVVDPYGYVNHIRLQRNLMVQTEVRHYYVIYTVNSLSGTPSGPTFAVRGVCLCLERVNEY